MSFQTKVNITPAPAVAGDFASINPRATTIGGPGQIVAGENGVNIGKFAWLDVTGTKAYSHGTFPKAPDGFVHREQLGLITGWLVEYGTNIPEGMPVTMFRTGDFFAKNEGIATSAIGDTVYTNYNDGSVATALPVGSTCTASIGGRATASIGATATSCTAQVDNTQILLSGTYAGVVSVGDTLIGTGIPADTIVVSQLTGTPGDTGIYQLNKSTTASAASVVVKSTNLIITTLTRGNFFAGDVLTGAGITYNTKVVTAPGAGGTGVYVIDIPQQRASAACYATSMIMAVTAYLTGTIKAGDPISGSGVTSNTVLMESLGNGLFTLSLASTDTGSITVTAVSGVATTWTVASIGAVGELIKITRGA